MGYGPVGGVGCGPVGGFTTAGVILVLFILLVIVTRSILC
nr:YjcZ family sporulation protein [Paenibacillus sp. sptzw28]